ncbi:J domain-containing protein [Saccharothrix sp. S26]|uniref:DnaJ C-terminal domain-containing protein n=1 Tax=Saccharothrix sp. S26 TaxID=2907215 RepID=UPI001F44C4D3|nr:J domain-containing protein [Saccharothrix sp. S26]MCE6997115.1 J domain-containing protein [Saccharothrix sp. S26]
MAGRDFYATLGVPRGASQDEIQRAYRALARRYHPDRNAEPGADERFREVCEAYRVLSDPERRRRYDAGRAARADRPGRAARPVGDQVWVSAGPGFGTSFGLGGDGLFGGGWSGGRPVRGADHEAELVLTVEEAYRGGRRSLTLPGPRTLRVDLPPGVTEGRRIRLPGAGEPGVGGAGDLYLVVRLAPHDRYRVEGRDLLVDLPLAPWEAALGGTVEIDTPGGPTTIRVPPGTSSGRRLRLRGQGLPDPGGEAGDLCAEVRIVVPATLDEPERRLFAELAATSDFNPRA